MAMDAVPSAEWWLGELATRLDYRRSNTYLLRSYMDGYAPLPEGAEGCREAYQQFQKKARTNYAELVTAAVCDRMQPGWFRVGDSEEDDDTARGIWKDNKLQIWSNDVHWDMIGLGHGYICVQPGSNGVEILYERPEQTIVAHDPGRPDKRRAALKVYRDDVYGVDVAYLHLPGLVYRYYRNVPVQRGFVRPLTSIVGGWELESVSESGLTTIPIVPFINRRGLGEFETHLDTLDRINWNILQRLVIIAMQAYRQRALKGDLPEKDEKGNPIDYGAIFRPGAGALWELPAGVELWESAQADLTGILESSREDVKALAAVTQTPMSVLMPDSANQSAEGASFAREGLVFKTQDRIARASAAWAEGMKLAFAIDQDIAEEDVPQIDVIFMPPERLSLAERADALSKVGDKMPFRSQMTKIMGLDGDEVDRMVAERAADSFLAPVFTPSTPSALQAQVETGIASSA